MFDIGFPELVLISIVALLVIGPERLPETIRTIMLWVGRVRSTFTNIKTELEQELGTDEIRRQIHNESIMKEIRESKEKISDVLKEADQSVQEFKHSINESVDAAKTKDSTDVAAPPNQQTESPVENSKDDEPKRRTH